MDEQKNEVKKEEIINLMGIYLSEWEHRDTLLWSQVFKLFYANLIVIILPNIASFIGIDLPSINEKIYPIIGIIMSLIFLYVGIGYCFRLMASSRTYVKLMKQLNKKEYERVPLDDDDERINDDYKMPKIARYFSTQMVFVLVPTMFLSLIVLSLVILNLS